MSATPPAKSLALGIELGHALARASLEDETTRRKAAAAGAPVPVSGAAAVAAHKAGRSMIEFVDNVPDKPKMRRRVNLERRGLKSLMQKNDVPMSGRQKRKMRKAARAHDRAMQRSHTQPESHE